MSTGSPVPARVAAGATRSSWGWGSSGEGPWREACQPSRHALLGCRAWLWVWFSQNTKPSARASFSGTGPCARCVLTQDTVASKESGLVQDHSAPSWAQQLAARGGGCLLELQEQLDEDSHDSKGSQHLRAPVHLLLHSGSCFEDGQSKRFAGGLARGSLSRSLSNTCFQGQGLSTVDGLLA